MSVYSNTIHSFTEILWINIKYAITININRMNQLIDRIGARFCAIWSTAAVFVINRLFSCSDWRKMHVTFWLNISLCSLHFGSSLHMETEPSYATVSFNGHFTCSHFFYSQLQNPRLRLAKTEPKWMIDHTSISAKCSRKICEQIEFWRREKDSVRLIPVRIEK